MIGTTSDSMRLLTHSTAGSIMVANQTLRATDLPYSVSRAVSAVMYVPDRSCKKQQTIFSYMSSDPFTVDPLEVIIKVPTHYIERSRAEPRITAS